MIVDSVGQGYRGVLIWALGWTEVCRQGAKEVLRHVVVGGCGGRWWVGSFVGESRSSRRKRMEDRRMRGGECRIVAERLC